MVDLKKFTEIDLEALPCLPKMDVFTLRGTIERGVKKAIKPWMLAAELPVETSDYQLQGIYDEAIKEYTDSILSVFINEYLQP